MYSHIDKLPIEMLVYLFKKLDLINYASLRLVCKKWKWIIDNEMIIKELNLIDHKQTFKNSWFFTNDLIYYKYALNYYSDMNSNNLVNSLKLNKLFKNLRKINLSFEIDVKFDLEFLNYFVHLNQLEIYSIKLIEKKELNFKNLEMLSIFKLESNLEFNLNEKILFINCYKLRKLFVGENINLIQLSNADMIYQLNIGSLNHNDDLNEFVNIEILNFFCELKSQIPIDIRPFKNLKKINFIDENFSFNNKFPLDFARAFFKYLLTQRKLLNKLDLEISYQGIKLLDENKITKNMFLTAIDFSKFKNYSLLIDNLSFFTRIQFIDLLKFSRNNNIDFIDLSSTDFFTKFNNIQIVVAESYVIKNNCDLFIDFLRKLPNLTDLILQYIRLDQQFYDIIPTICPNLTFLSIYEHNRININFDFLFKLIYLTSFETTKILDFKFVIELFKNCNYLYKIDKFNNNRYWYRLLKIGKNTFNLERWKYGCNTAVFYEEKFETDQFEINNLTFNELIKYFNLNINKTSSFSRNLSYVVDDTSNSPSLKLVIKKDSDETYKVENKLKLTIKKKSIEDIENEKMNKRKKSY